MENRINIHQNKNFKKQLFQYTVMATGDYEKYYQLVKFSSKGEIIC